MATKVIKRTAGFVAKHNAPFIKQNPKATLGDLVAHLEKALEQCEWHLGEQINDAVEVDGIEPELMFEIAQFEQDEVPDEEYTFDYRHPNIEENLEDVRELADALGNDVRLSTLKR